MEIYRLKACAKCGGDLAYDEGDWICLQCGRYYYADLRRRRSHPRLLLDSDEWLAKGVGIPSTPAMPLVYSLTQMSASPGLTAGRPGIITR